MNDNGYETMLCTPLNGEDWIRQMRRVQEGSLRLVVGLVDADGAVAYGEADDPLIRALKTSASCPWSIQSGPAGFAGLLVYVHGGAGEIERIIENIH